MLDRKINTESLQCSAQNRDTLYAEKRSKAPFTFNAAVADVFDDMLLRSVPGYRTITHGSAALCARFAQKGDIVFDLGASLGTASIAVADALMHAKRTDIRICAIDSSEAMVARCRARITACAHTVPITVCCDDICKKRYTGAGIVLLLFTLQFIAPDAKSQLLRTIFDDLRIGGIVLIAEKIALSDKEMDALFIDVHHTFKKNNGYSDLEISQKREALDKVLTPETIDIHKQRLHAAGFRRVTVWYRYFNFVAFMAQK